jgi:hypothetical protein
VDVHADDHVAGGFLHEEPQARSLEARGVIDHANPRIGLGEPRQDLARLVGRAPVADEDLDLVLGIVLGLDARDARFDVVLFVIRGHRDGDALHGWFILARGVVACGAT